MIRSTTFDDVLFVEANIPNAPRLGRAKVSLNGGFSQAQLKNLNDVKRQLAAKVKSQKGNAIINFKYGQRSTFWGSIFSLDNVAWFGEGDVTTLRLDSSGNVTA